MPLSIETTVSIVNQRGLHARAAAKIVAAATPFDAEITIAHDRQTANAKSILGLMMLAASQGSELQITASGSDAEAAAMAIKMLMESGFHEPPE
ncbi:MAG: HPr family phosphocarrier protein [Gammaproteobacteria bacterium]|mgnify:CR=1 FL=1|nr:HPr family phosphocarrier protein [Gammaproteobacteria bacterium]